MAIPSYVPSCSICLSKPIIGVRKLSGMAILFSFAIVERAIQQSHIHEGAVVLGSSCEILELALVIARKATSRFTKSFTGTNNMLIYLRYALRRLWIFLFLVDDCKYCCMRQPVVCFTTMCDAIRPRTS